jgi:undecaprenyl-diphosphatase
MSILEAILLGIVQGLTEFLPVSSSGHLVMAQVLLDIRMPGVVLEVALHFATLLSILIVYRKRFSALVAGLIKGDAAQWRYGWLLVLATIPAAVVGLGAKPLFEQLFERPVVTGVALLVTGSFLWSSRWAMRRVPDNRIGVREAFLMGIAQSFALVPGISRSGSTVVTALWLKVNAEEAAEFSFLMLVPAILGATILEIPNLQAEAAAGGLPLLLGALAAALTGVLAIWAFLVMLRRKAFHRFGPYGWTVGLLFLGYLALR